MDHLRDRGFDPQPAGRVDRYIAHALEEGDAAPNRNLLAYLVDGEV